jgi:hypothetical protein
LHGRLSIEVCAMIARELLIGTHRIR